MANTTPIFAVTPNAATAVIAAANTARDGSGTLVTAFTAGTNGSVVESITFRSAQLSAAASTAMVVRVFLTDTGGANPRLICEGALATVTPSNTAIGAFVCFNFVTGQIITASASTLLVDITTPLVIASGQIIKVTQSVFAGVQDQNHVFVKGGDF